MRSLLKIPHLHPRGLRLFIKVAPVMGRVVMELIHIMVNVTRELPVAEGTREILMVILTPTVIKEMHQAVTAA
jgi:hypothetical protein